jgi:hypothetical protein
LFPSKPQNMKYILLAICFVLVNQSASAPVDPEDEIEIIPVMGNGHVQAGAEEPSFSGRFPMILIRGGGGGGGSSGFPGGFPFFGGGFPSFGSGFPSFGGSRFPSSFGGSRIPGFGQDYDEILEKVDTTNDYEDEFDIGTIFSSLGNSMITIVYGSILRPSSNNWASYRRLKWQIAALFL